MLTVYWPQGSLNVASGAQIPASCVLACYWSMVVCYWGISQSQTTTQLAGIWAPLHGDQQHTGTLVFCQFLHMALIIIICIKNVSGIIRN